MLQGYKITALSIHCKLADDSAGSQSKDMSLRRAAIWYPEPPSDDLLLNDNSFTGLRPDPTTYQPLSWIQFGGRGGGNLSHVQGVLVLFDDALLGLQFIYDRAVPGTGTSTSERFGRCGSTDMEEASLFSIDGAGGERITSISVGLRVYENDNYPNYYHHGVVQYLTVRILTATR